MAAGGLWSLQWALPQVYVYLQYADRSVMSREADNQMMVSMAHGIWEELKRNVTSASKYLLFDTALLLACAINFYLNRYWLIEGITSLFPDTVVSYLFRCHFNDFIGGCAFMAYTNMLLDLIKPDTRFSRLPSVILFILLCGIFWEAIAPLFLSDSTGDPFDVIAYVLGSLVYFVLNRLVIRRARTTE